MSINGTITFFREEQAADAGAMIDRLIEVIGPTDVCIASRSTGESHEGQDLLEEQEGDESEDIPILMPASDLMQNEEKTPCPMPAGDLRQHYREGTSLSVVFGESPLGIRMHDAIRDGIDKSIRDDFMPGDVDLRIAAHDLIDTTQFDEAFLIARPFVSIAFFGYSCPHDWNEFRRQVFRLDAVKQIKAELEQATGRLREWASWSV